MRALREVQQHLHQIHCVDLANEVDSRGFFIEVAIEFSEGTRRIDYVYLWRLTGGCASLTPPFAICLMRFFLAAKRGNFQEADHYNDQTFTQRCYWVMEDNRLASIPIGPDGRPEFEEDVPTVKGYTSCI